MTWIKVIEEDEATGRIGDYYAKARKEGRRVSNIHKAASLNPLAMEAIDLFQMSWREEGALKPRHRELVALVTSALNRCKY